MHSKSTPLVKILCLPVAAWMVFTGCGSSGFSTPFFNGTSSNQGTGDNGSPGSPVLSGKVLVRSISPISAELAPRFESLRSDLTSNGYLLSQDARYLARPSSAAASWTVELGNQIVLIEADGSFSLQAPTDGAREGVFRHPTDSQLAFPFTLADLAKARASGGSIELPLVLDDPCAMRSDDFCSQPVRPRVTLDNGPTQPDGYRPALREYNRPRSIDTTPLGTYPLPVTFECRIEDGFAPSPFGLDTPAAYFGSTCDVYVLAGACPNENPATDAEFRRFRETYRSDPALAQSIFGNNVPILEFLPGARVHCDQNHKGRSCAHLVVGDVACQIQDGKIVKAGESWVVSVQVGQKVFFAVHNNGVYGVTKIVKIKNEAEGNLANPAGSVGLVGKEVRHYTPVDYVANYEANNKPSYKPDRILEYSPGGDAAVGKEDTFRFIVDDKEVRLTFRVASAPPFLTRLGSDAEVAVQDLNAAGTYTSVRDGKTYLEPLGQERIELLAEPGLALLNDQGHCLYQANNHQSHAVFRAGEVNLDLKPPTGSLSVFADGIVSLSPEGLAFAKARRPDGKNDFFTTTDGGERFFLAAPEGLAPSTEVTVLNATTRDALYGNSPGGSVQSPDAFEGFSNAGKLVRWDFASRSWASNITAPRADFLPAFGDRYVDATSNGVLRSVFGNNFSPAAPPAGVTWFSFFNNILLSGNRDFERQMESRVETSAGVRTVVNTTEPIPSTGAFATHTVSGVNDAGEVIGTYRDAGGQKFVLFSPTGERQSIDSLLPAGAPAGTWSPIRIAGRYMLLTHTDSNGAASVYLWFRGPAAN